MPTSSRLAIVTPTLATTPTDIPADMLAIVTALEARGTGFSQGTFATRPAAGKSGWFYWDTTNSVLWYDNGTIWIGPIGAVAAGSITQAMLALGAAAGQAYGTTFPTSSLYNGYRFTIFLSNPAGGSNMYDAVYRADLDATYPWHVEGEILLSEVVAPESTAGTSYGVLGTAGPSITLARAGVYVVEVGFHGYAGATLTDRLYMSYDIGGTGASDNDSAKVGISGGGTVGGGSVTRKRVKTITSVSTALVSKYRTEAGNANCLFADRSLAVRPLRLI